MIFFVKYWNRQIPFKDFVLISLNEESLNVKDLEGIKLDCFSYKNNFVIDDYEISIKYTDLNEYYFKVYDKPNFKNHMLKFGCELEICILESCTNKKSYISKILKSKNEKIILETWKDLVISFIDTTILSGDCNKFIKLFPKIYIVFNPKSGLSDYIYDTKTKIVENIVKEIKYDNLIITRDISVVCGDNKLRKHGYEDTFHCEIVTQILHKRSDLKTLYEKIFYNKCLKSNNSSGFHVNVSIVYTKNNNIYPIYYTDGIISRFLDYFEGYEKSNYDKYRPNGSKYASKILLHAQEYTYKYMRPILDIEDVNHFYSNFISGKRYYKCMVDLSEKYNSIHLKDDNILEFRLFPSKENYIDLLDYVLDCLELLEKTLKDYKKDYFSIVNNLQGLNLDVKISYEPIKKYNGYLYLLINNEFVELNENFDNLEYILNSLFNLHNQVIIDCVKLKDNHYTIVAENELLYNLIIHDGRRFEIYLI